jgi:hypothetical protein
MTVNRYAVIATDPDERTTEYNHSDRSVSVPIVAGPYSRYQSAKDRSEEIAGETEAVPITMTNEEWYGDPDK